MTKNDERSAQKVNLKNKNVLIVGGTSGLGFYTAREFLKKGAQVFVTGRSFNKNDEAKNDFQKVNFIHQEFSSKEFSYTEEFLDALKKCSVLVLSFGPFVLKPIEQMTDGEWQDMAVLNYALYGSLVSRVIPFMKARGEGSILAFGGTYSQNVRGYKDTAAYSGAKTAVSVLVKSVHLQYGTFNIKCNALLPGFVTNVPAGKPSTQAKDVANFAVNIVESGFSGGIFLQDGTIL